MIVINNLFLLFGSDVKTKKNKTILLRKRWMHKGYQLSDIAYRNSEVIYTEINNFNTMLDVEKYLKNN